MRLSLVLAFALLAFSSSRVSAQDLAPASVARAEVASATPEPETEEDRRVAEGLAERQRLRPWHILFGNLTWAASNIASIFGYIQFNDRFGWDGDPTHTGCAQGSAVFGEYCDPNSTPVPHVVAITALTIFYGSAFTVSALMPDPLEVGEGHNDLAMRITVHRALRWTSLAILLAQIVLGAISANVDFNDFGADRAMAATHLALGTVSWGVITAQGVLGSLLAY